MFLLRFQPHAKTLPGSSQHPDTPWCRHSPSCRDLILTALFFSSLLFSLFPAPGNTVAGTKLKIDLEQNPPLSFMNDQGKAGGILITLLEHIAKEEGWELEYVPASFNKCLENLQNREIDLMVTIALTPERAKIFDFNRVNVIANWGQLYASANTSIQSYFDLSGKEVAVVSKDSHQQTFRTMLDRFGIKTHYIEVDNFADVFHLLENKQVDAGVVGRFYALQNEKNFKGIKPTPLIFNPIEVHYAVPKGMHANLLATLDQHLTNLQANKSSFYYQTLDNWLGLIGQRGLPHWLQLSFISTAGIILLLLFFNLALRSRVKSRTKHLELEILERNRAEKSLRASEHKYRELVENANSIILRMDCNGNILFFNEFAEQFFGFKQAEIIGRNVVGTIVPKRDSDGHDLRRMIEQICRTPEAFTHNENENICKSGKRIWVSWTNKPLFGTNGEWEGVLAVGQDITQRKRYEADLVRQATYDPLTNLPNRSLLADRLTHAILRANRRNVELSVMLLDLDNFKIINDTMGHSVGDQLLIIVAKRLESLHVKVDTIARLGGDEFVILHDNQDGIKSAARLAEEILQLFSTPFHIAGHEFFISISLGVALYPNDGQNIDILLKHADVAMYHAKKQGKNNYQFFTPDINKDLHKRMATETQLRRALEREEFLVYYQPQIDIQNRTICGMEALLRWQPTGEHIVFPNEFIPILEETGLIVPIGEWILKTACQQAKAWTDAGWPSFTLSVNISARQFQQPNLDMKILQILKETGLNPTHLCLELTETMLMQNTEEVISKMHALRHAGIKLAIDDFGTGYSSLSYLQRMPINQLKIDRSFIATPHKNLNNSIIINTILSMAHCLNIDVVAEGVETEQQLRSLSAQNCKQIQGYYFSTPLPSDKFNQVLMPSDSLRSRIETFSVTSPPSNSNI